MALAQQPASVKRVHYAWIVAGVTFLALLAAAGLTVIQPVACDLAGIPRALSAQKNR